MEDQRIFGDWVDLFELNFILDHNFFILIIRSALLFLL